MICCNFDGGKDGEGWGRVGKEGKGNERNREEVRGWGGRGKKGRKWG